MTAPPAEDMEWEAYELSPEKLGYWAANSPGASALQEACLQRDLQELGQRMATTGVDLELVKMLRPDLAARLG